MSKASFIGGLIVGGLVSWFGHSIYSHHHPSILNQIYQNQKTMREKINKINVPSRTDTVTVIDTILVEVSDYHESRPGEVSNVSAVRDSLNLARASQEAERKMRESLQVSYNSLQKKTETQEKAVGMLRDSLEKIQVRMLEKRVEETVFVQTPPETVYHAPEVIEKEVPSLYRVWIPPGIGSVGDYILKLNNELFLLDKADQRPMFEKKKGEYQDSQFNLFNEIIGNPKYNKYLNDIEFYLRTGIVDVSDSSRAPYLEPLQEQKMFFLNRIRNIENEKNRHN